MPNNKELEFETEAQAEEFIPAEHVPQDHIIKEAALGKLRQDILSKIAMHHQELRRAQEESFDKLWVELLSTISGITPDNKQPQQLAADPKHTLDPRTNTMQPDLNHGLQAHVTSGCNANAGSVPVATHGPPNPEETLEPSPDDDNFTLEPSRDDPDFEQVSPSESCHLRLWTRDSKRAMGEFKNHPELYAFLQAKNWDSDFSKALVVEHADSSFSAIDSPLWKNFSSAIQSTTFDLCIGLLIMANSVVMGLRLEYEGMFSADKIGITRDEGNWPNAGPAFSALEHIFAIAFIIELILRITVMGRQYFKQPLNIMDFAIVAVSVLDLYVFTLADMDFPNVTFIRLLRIFKLVRAMRIIRMLKFFENLRVLVAAVSHSMRSFIWSILLLGVVQLIASIFMTQSLQSYLQDESADLVKRKQVYEFFGSWSRSLITVFEMTFAIGTWGRCGRIVIFSVDRHYALFFFGYLAVVSFAMIRVIAALFLKDTLASAAKDTEKHMADVNRNPDYIQQVRMVFSEMDVNGDGFLSMDEIHTVLHDKRIAVWLKKLGVEPRELKGLFDLMDDGDNHISEPEFLAGIMRLKNANKGVDLATLLFENKKILTRVLAVSTQMKQLKDDLHGHVPSILDSRASIYPTTIQPRSLSREPQQDKISFV